MMMILTFILIVVYMTAKTIFLETKQDQCIIENADPKKDKEGWKLYGALMQAAEIGVLTTLGYVVTGNIISLLLVPVLVLTYSICHDCGISYRLNEDNPKLSLLGKFFQLGNGKWDTQIKKIFQGGLLWFIFKAVWLGGAAVAYFSL